MYPFHSSGDNLFKMFSDTQNDLTVTLTSMNQLGQGMLRITGHQRKRSRYLALRLKNKVATFREAPMIIFRIGGSIFGEHIVAPKKQRIYTYIYLMHKGSSLFGNHTAKKVVRVVVRHSNLSPLSPAGG